MSDMGGFEFPAEGAFVSHCRREARLQPGLKALLHARDEGQHGLAPEGAIGLGVIAEIVVAGQAQQQRRHAEGERDLARRARLGSGAAYDVAASSARISPIASSKAGVKI
jgi:hypothetical protein